MPCCKTERTARRRMDESIEHPHIRVQGTPTVYAKVNMWYHDHATHGESNMHYPRPRAAFIGASAALLIYAACGGDSPAPTTAPPTPTPRPAVEPTPVPQVEVTSEQIQNAVAAAIEERGADAAPADVRRYLEGEMSPDGLEGVSDLEQRIEDQLAHALDDLAQDTPDDPVDVEGEEESDPDVLFRYMSAVNTLYAGQNEESISTFDLIIRVHPNMPRAYYYRGVAFYRSDQHEQAMADFDKAIELDPESGDPYLQRGMLHYDAGDSASALQDFDRAIQLAPWLADAYRNRGAIKLNEGRTNEGLSDFQRALEIYAFERNQERVDEARQIISDPPDEPIEMFKATDILPRLP